MNHMGIHDEPEMRAAGRFLKLVPLFAVAALTLNYCTERAVPKPLEFRYPETPPQFLHKNEETGRYEMRIPGAETVPLR